MTPRAFRVAGREQDTRGHLDADVRAGRAAGRRRSRPGQFMMVYAFGIGEVPISVSGASGRHGPVVLTVRAVGAVSSAICAATPGTVLGLRGPFGNAWPIDEAAGGDVVVVAGGIGLAPLRPVDPCMCSSNADGTAASACSTGARTPGRPPLRRRARELARARPTSRSPSTRPTATGAARSASSRSSSARARFRPDRAHAFVCGPEIMMHFTVEALLARGVCRRNGSSCRWSAHMDCGIGLCGHCQLGPTLDLPRRPRLHATPSSRR